MTDVASINDGTLNVNSQSDANDGHGYLASKDADQERSKDEIAFQLLGIATQCVAFHKTREFVIELLRLSKETVNASHAALSIRLLCHGGKRLVNHSVLQSIAFVPVELQLQLLIKYRYA